MKELSVDIAYSPWRQSSGSVCFASQLNSIREFQLHLTSSSWLLHCNKVIASLQYYPAFHPQPLAVQYRDWRAPTFRGNTLWTKCGAVTRKPQLAWYECTQPSFLREDWFVYGGRKAVEIFPESFDMNPAKQQATCLDVLQVRHLLDRKYPISLRLFPHVKSIWTVFSMKGPYVA